MSDESNSNTTPTEGAATNATGATNAPGGDQDALAAITAERDRLKDQLLRSLADQDNYRKRVLRDKDEAVRKAREDLLRELLPVFDNLDRASQYVTSGADSQAIGKGVEMVLRLFEDTISKLGGKRLKSVGQPFDPTQHEAIQQIETTEQPAGSVVREEMAGYLLNDRLLRPALVVVSRGAPPKPDGGQVS